MTIFRKSLLFCLTMVCLAQVGLAQVTSQESAPAEMKQLDFLIGNWTGSGTISRGPGPAMTADVVEKVQSKLQGTVVLIEGRGTVDQDDGQPMIVHDALAVVSYDRAAKKFVIRTYRAGGEMLEPEITVENQTLQWQFANERAGTIRFTITVDGDQWTEIGEASRDGQQWFQFFEMNLTKKPPQ